MQTCLSSETAIMPGEGYFEKNSKKGIEGFIVKEMNFYLLNEAM